MDSMSLGRMARARSYAVAAASAFETDRQLAKIGSPVDRDEWFMLPQTVNAYYNPGTNEICFPAGILQKPFFSPDAEPAENYGGIGAVIGHEIGHGFDDQGSQYDGDGNMENWWTDADRSAFEVKTKALISQYDGFELRDLPGEKVNGSLTVGENIGDLGGLTIAYKAFQIASGGTAGDVRFGVLRGSADGSAPALVLYRQGYKLGVARRNRRSFEVIQPHYKAGEPNCCPSSFRKRRYTWRGHHFKAGKAKKLRHAPARFYRP